MAHEKLAFYPESAFHLLGGKSLRSKLKSSDLSSCAQKITSFAVRIFIPPERFICGVFPKLLFNELNFARTLLWQLILFK